MPHNVVTIALAVNCLVVLGSTTDSDELTDIAIEGLSSPVTVPVHGYCGFEVTPDWRRKAVETESIGFIFACPLDFDLAREIGAATHPISIELRSRGRAVGKASGEVCSLLDKRMRNAGKALELLCGELAEANPTFARIVASVAKGEQASTSITAHLEQHLVAPGTGFVASGWAENLSEHAIVFLLDELRFAVNPEQVFPHLRGDVSRHIAEEGRHSATPLHGFTLADIIAGDRHELRLASLSGARIKWSPPLDVSHTGSVRRVLQLLSTSVAVREIQSRGASSRMLQRFLANFTAPKATAAIVEYKAPERVPDLSIIVPFYRDDFFLVDHLESQRRTAANAEWIFISDDPSLNASMARTCRARSEGLTKATKLISLSENLGFARANNLAFQSAKADYVAFMNSDIYWRSLAPVEYGLDILRQDASVGIVGFVLRFEDETLQHAGMRFEAMPEHDGMLLTIHDGKGLPAKRHATITAREVEAVTGALMLVRRADFQATVFDEGYVGGDFEDSDLCLQMRARGKRIVLVECEGLYHLERQSIGAGDSHQLFTYVNGARFTAKWGGAGRLLATPETDRDVVRAQAAEPASVELEEGNVDDATLADCAVHLHLFYPDLLDEAFSYLTRPHMRALDTYITVTDRSTEAHVAAEIVKSGRTNVLVERVVNVGRDLAPLFIHQNALFARYKYVCHLHTKKSPHTDFGDAWRRYLFDAIVGSEEIVHAVVAHLENNAETGIAYPEAYFRITPFMSHEANREKIDFILRGMNPAWRYESVGYPAGSMCWLRCAAFRGALDRFPALSAFEQEEGQIDGTLAHALERCLVLIPKLSGYASVCYSPHRVRPRLARSA